MVYVSDTGSPSIIGVDLRTGEQFLISAGGILGVPFGIAVERDGNILAANTQAIIRIDIHTGEQSVVASGGLLSAPLWVAVTARGDILVVDASRKIIGVDPKTGKQTMISQGGLLKAPQDLAVHDDDIYVADVATADGNFGVGRIVHIELPTGTQRVVAEGGWIVEQGSVATILGCDRHRDFCSLVHDGQGLDPPISPIDGGRHRDVTRGSRTKP